MEIARKEIVDSTREKHEKGGRGGDGRNGCLPKAMWQPLYMPRRKVFKGDRAAFADPISTTLVYMALGFKSELSPKPKVDILRPLLFTAW